MNSRCVLCGNSAFTLFIAQECTNPQCQNFVPSKGNHLAAGGFYIPEEGDIVTPIWKTDVVINDKVVDEEFFDEITCVEAQRVKNSKDLLYRVMHCEISKEEFSYKHSKMIFTTISALERKKVIDLIAYPNGCWIPNAFLKLIERKS